MTFVFAGILRLIAAPFYLFGKHIHFRYLWLLLQGAVARAARRYLRAASAEPRNSGSPIVVAFCSAYRSLRRPPASFAPR